MNDGARLSTALLLSLVLHAGLLALLSVGMILRDVEIAVPSLLDVDLVSLPPRPAVVEPPAPEPPPQPAQAEEEAPQAPSIALPEYQIVSPPDAGEEKPPEKTRFLSDRDVSVEQEMVRRGEPASQPPPPARQSQQAEQSKRAQAEPPSRKPADSASSSRSAPQPPAAAHQPPPLPGMKELLPSASELAREGYLSKQEPGSETAAKPEPPEGSDLLRYADAWPSSSKRRGTLDFLPDVREGDITLLNTKAEMFAPFVRRVGVRVFGHFVILLRRELSQLAGGGRESVTLEAVMNRDGDLVTLNLKGRSAGASLGTDRSLQRACYEGFFDRNPPPGAEANDGNIHFLLNAQVMSLVSPDGRRLGYQAVFSAGLL